MIAWVEMSGLAVLLEQTAAETSKNMGNVKKIIISQFVTLFKIKQTQTNKELHTKFIENHNYLQKMLTER